MPNQRSRSAQRWITSRCGYHCQIEFPVARYLACGSHAAASAVLSLRCGSWRLLRESRDTVRTSSIEDVT